jgi:predicted CopG family antitoxin
LLRIDSNAKKKSGKNSLARIYRQLFGTKELVTLLERVANSSKNEDVIKKFQLHNGIKDPSGRKF